MRLRQSAALCLPIVILLTNSALVSGRQLPMEPSHDSGQSITGAFEGWFGNPDGSYSLLVGYYNRNTKRELDIPIGPNNRIEPGGPDQGPAHPLPARQAVGRFHHHGAEGFRDEEAHVDSGHQRPDHCHTDEPQSSVWRVSPFIDGEETTAVH